MKILFTGASSFTGYWFVRELVAAGHEVTATFRQPAGEYGDVRARRVASLANCCQPVHGVPFGSAEFIELLNRGSFDVLCHHAADVTNYKSADFNTVEALAGNTRHLAPVLAAFAGTGGRGVVLTGTVFENGEGAGSDDLPAFSPYGLSKGLTSEAFRYYTRAAGLPLAKFVIPNPFGPFEEPRFTAYLARTWFANKPASVETPDYVRDNIHVSLLARCYAKFVAGVPYPRGFTKLNPSGYIESQGAFAQRVARELRPRLGLPCELELKVQTKFTEPRIRINTDVPDAIKFDESAAWDDIANYYASIFSGARA